MRISRTVFSDSVKSLKLNSSDQNKIRCRYDQLYFSNYLRLIEFDNILPILTTRFALVIEHFKKTDCYRVSVWNQFLEWIYGDCIHYGQKCLLFISVSLKVHIFKRVDGDLWCTRHTDNCVLYLEYPSCYCNQFFWA